MGNSPISKAPVEEAIKKISEQHTDTVTGKVLFFVSKLKFNSG